MTQQKGKPAKASQPTWSVCLGEESLLLIKTTDTKNARAIAHENGAGADSLIYIDETEYGDCWEKALACYPDYFDDWEEEFFVKDVLLGHRMASLGNATHLYKVGIRILHNNGISFHDWGFEKLLEEETKMMEQKNDKPTWSVCLGSDNLLIIKTADRAAAQAVAREWIANGPIYTDIKKCGDCWRAKEANPEYFQDWGLDFPDTLDFSKFEQFDNVHVIHCDGRSFDDEEIEELKDMKEEMEEEMEEMEDAPDLKAKVLESAKTMVGAAALGGKLSLAQKANEAAYTKFGELVMAQGVSKELIENSKFKALVMSVLPAGLHMAASVFEDQIPHVKHIKPGLELSMTETAREHSAELLNVVTTLFGAMYQAYLPEAGTSKKLRIEPEYEDFRTDKLRGMAKARELGLKARITRDKLIAALYAADELHEEEDSAHESCST